MRSVRHLATLSVVIVAGMYALLFVAFRGAYDTLIVLVNLPLALIGGIVAVPATSPATRSRCLARYWL